MSSNFSQPVAKHEMRQDLGLMAATGLLTKKQISERFGYKYRTVQTWERSQKNKLSKLAPEVRLIQIERERIRLTEKYLQDDVQTVAVVDESEDFANHLNTQTSNPIKPSSITSSKYTNSSIGSIVSNGIAQVKAAIEGLQNDSVGSLTEQKNMIRKLSERIEELISQTTKPTDINALVKSLDILVRLSLIHI